GETRYFAYDQNGNKRTFADARGRVTTYEYDKRDRLKKTIEPANRVTENWYDWMGNKTDVQFPDGRTNRWRWFDPFGQPAHFIDERDQTTALWYRWGPMKQPSTVMTRRDTELGGSEEQWTNFHQDGMGRPQQVQFPDGTSEQTWYEFGQPRSYKNRKGEYKWLHYDARGRERWHSWSNEAAPTVVKDWDNAHRLTHTRNKFSSIDYSYDAAGQVKTETNNIAGSGGGTTLTYLRYPNGKPSRLIYPMGWWLRQDHTARGQLKAIGWDGGTGNWQHKLIDYTYNPDGTVAWQYYGNGTQTGFAYDERRQKRIVHTHRQNWYENYSHRTYHRDDRDRIWAWQKSSDNRWNSRETGRGDRYQYDAEGQLTQAWYEAWDPAGNMQPIPGNDDNFGSWAHNGNVARGYDQLGNRRGWSWLASRGWTYFNRRDGNGLNKYFDWSGAGTNYDANGSLFQEGHYHAEFNALNQPVRIWAGGRAEPTNFAYDPLGRCVKRWVSHDWSEGANPATYLYYDGWNLVQEGPSAWNAEWLYFHGGRVDEMVAAYHRWSDGWNYYHHDARGHTNLLTDWWGNMVEQYDYHAFGQVYTYTYDDASKDWVQVGETRRGNRFLFTGREWLKDLGIYDYRHRMYHPGLGRFLQPDPLHFKAGDYNLYRYCHNDPINKSDPLGLRWVVEDKELRKQFDAARAYLSKDPGMKKAFDAIDKSKTNVYVRENKSLAPGATKTQLLQHPKTGEFSVRINWNPHAAASVKGGSQSPAMVLGHEGQHGERFIRDPKGAIRDTNTRAPGFGNREEQRVITGPEANAARTLGETPRSSGDARFYPVEDVTDR
ncbi:MAG TPA: RHS repeat-associated core domain-containing protein, partial [Chthoniobacterales bacterium]|nr:RHS repeat-associated core domain-containing protein [Chthoniobacterales bacterium]